VSTHSDTLASATSRPSPSLRSGEWQIDPARSRVHFHTRALGGLFPVRGRFERFDGTLHVDAEERTSGALRIEAASIRTGISLRDAHLRTKDFFHTKEAPQLVFDLDALEPADDGYDVSGALQIRDKSVPIRARAEVEPADSEITIRARFPLDHDAAGLGWAKPGMVPKVVDADVELTLVRDAAAG
jgi:polyisoprenoid-binding protein YceI